MEDDTLWHKLLDFVFDREVHVKQYLIKLGLSAIVILISQICKDCFLVSDYTNGILLGGAVTLIWIH